MKKLLWLMLLFVSITAAAQEDVTKFLGIPVDGTKSAMIQKLKAKGFRYDERLDCLTGEFNGGDVRISVVTNSNKVWRIMVEDEVSSSETDIKIRFNNLCRQFEKNEKYLPIKADRIPDEEDISYEMDVNNKRYESAFHQKSNSSKTMYDEIQSELSQTFTERQLLHPTEDEKEEILLKKYELFEKWYKKVVWFMINERYGRYRIIMYYDNEYNHSDGEDL